jgi:hypothetical protein
MDRNEELSLLRKLRSELQKEAGDGGLLPTVHNRALAQLALVEAQIARLEGK